MKLPEFLEAVKKHADWLKGLASGVRLEFHGKLEVDVGVRADLSWADLSRADLSRANLSEANLSRADLSRANLSEANLSGASLSRANLSEANLSRANLSRANLSGASLSWADLSEADLSGASLSWADLSEADLDYSSLPLFRCSSTTIKADIRFAAQLAYHFCRIDFGDCPEAKEAKVAIQALANKSHVITTHGLPEIQVENPTAGEKGE
jgi:uncharacterized protein YjbI with pentapeptide repeats